MANNIKITYKDGYVVLKPAKLNEKLEYRVQNARLLQRAFTEDPKTKERKISDYEAIAEWEKLDAEFFLKHIVEVVDLVDHDGTKLTIEHLNNGDISTELFKALQDSYKDALEVIEGNGQGK